VDLPSTGVDLCGRNRGFDRFLYCSRISRVDLVREIGFRFRKAARSAAEAGRCPEVRSLLRSRRRTFAGDWSASRRPCSLAELEGCDPNNIGPEEERSRSSTTSRKMTIEPFRTSCVAFERRCCRLK
jgi:hypothetical protein